MGLDHHFGFMKIKYTVSLLLTSLCISNCTHNDRSGAKLDTEFATDVISGNEIRAVDKFGKVSKDYLHAEKFYFKGNRFPATSTAFTGLILPTGKEIDARVQLKDGRTLLIEKAPSRNTWFLLAKTNQNAIRTSNGIFQEGPQLPFAIAFSHLTLLSDGRVLIVVANEESANGESANGESNPCLDCLLVFDPKSNRILEITRLSKPRYQPGIVELGNRNILVVGGETRTALPNRYMIHTPLIELVDLEQKTSTIVGQLHQARSLPQVFPVGKNQALILGGFRDGTGKDLWINTAELYLGNELSTKKSKAL